MEDSDDIAPITGTSTAAVAVAAAEVEEAPVARAPGPQGVAGLDERGGALAPGRRVQRVAAQVPQRRHLVLGGPAAAARVHESHPPAVRRPQELRALVHPVPSVQPHRELPLAVRPADHRGQLWLLLVLLLL